MLENTQAESGACHVFQNSDRKQLRLPLEKTHLSQGMDFCKVGILKTTAGTEVKIGEDCAAFSICRVSLHIISK
jgi:hypothetical protein